MSYIEEISWMSKSGYSDTELLEYIDKHFDEIEYELNGEEYKEPKKHNHYFCMGCKLRNIVDYEKSTLVCTKCGYPYEIPLTIPILECILKRNELSMYKDSIYFIYFKLRGGSFPHITPKEYDMILSVFNVISSIYDKYKPNDRKSLLNYSFVLKKLLIMLGKVEYAKYIPQLKTHSKQKELERVWELITKDREWAVALRKQKIA